jgi:hypothetical protein
MLIWMHLNFNGFSDETTHVTVFCREGFSVLQSDDVIMIKKLCSATADLSGWTSLMCLSCSLMRSWMDRPLYPMYTLPHSQGILYVPGVLNPGAALFGDM